jgi:hypothetical protein
VRSTSARTALPVPVTYPIIISSGRWPLSLSPLPSLRRVIVVVACRRLSSAACDLIPAVTSLSIRLARNFHGQIVICHYGIAFFCCCHCHYLCLCLCRCHGLHLRLCHRHCRCRCCVNATCWNLAGSGAPRLASLSLDLTDCCNSFSRARTWRWSREPAGWVAHSMPR